MPERRLLMKFGAKRVAIGLAAALGATVLIALWLGNVVYWGSEDRIEAYLRTQTPLGSPQSRVTQWLSTRGVPSQIHVAVVKPNSSYPPTKVGGSSFIHESIAHYRVIFRADIEAFYIFDSNGNLVDLRVRREVDAP
jgi:hypothetical protein